MGKTEMVEESSVIRARGFTKHYGKNLAANGIDLTAKKGEIYGLIGPDGAGKSTLMKAVAGVLVFDAGEVEVFGIRIDSERAAEMIKGRIGFMPQGLGLNLYHDLSVEENIDFFARIRLVPERELAERKKRLLAITRLSSFVDRPMKHLSGGMKQKLGLVCTLIHEPELVILDEPTTGVDPVSRRDFWAILNRLVHERGITALVSTAYMDEASRFHRLSLFSNGQILAEGRPGDIRSSAPGSEELDLEDTFIALLCEKGLIPEDTCAKVSGIRPAATTSREDIAIAAKGLVRDFDSFRAVDRVSFNIRYGEVFGLLGANGAGKTTVIRMLTGILPPTGGEGHVAGEEMHHAGKAIKERIGYMSQAFSLYRDLTVVENIRLYAGIYGLGRIETRKRTDWIIDMAGLSGHETSQAGSLPMGLRQRLALGCALVHSPQILFLDEPTSGVDPIGRRRFWDILFRLSREDGVAILITTHYMSEAELCDHLALMHAGRIVMDASPSDMKGQVEAEAGLLLEVATNQPVSAAEWLSKNGFPDAAPYGTRVHLFSRDMENDIRRVPWMLTEAGIPVESVIRRPLSMEDVFVYSVMSREKKQQLSGDMV